MKYKRFTKRIGDFITNHCKPSCPYYNVCEDDDCHCDKAALEILAELEDKIEQGTLKEEKTCKNIAEMHPSDGFTCSECGITIIDFREERVDEEDCTASWYEYEMKYCPNCGAKIIECKELQE